ncbi:MAG: DNA translocase FtsK [Candidatus Pacebacteria bacterium]|nr:DNA translocase FtsK [Candidatus Paceibacterota bacterium]MCF7856888.1 DNA translocase FtsK [Candidatus Paceibacterota bacterium]
MAKRRKQNSASQIQGSFFDDLSPHTKQAIVAIFFVVLAIFFIFSSLGYAGIAGEMTHDALYYLFGYGFVLAPIVCSLLVYVFLKPREDNRVSGSKIVGISLAFLAALALLELSFSEGGALGTIVFRPLTSLFGGVVTGIILVALFMVGLFLTFNTNFLHLFQRKDSEDLEDTEPIVNLPATDSEESEQENEEAESADEAAPKKKSLAEKILSRATGAEFVVSSFRGTYAAPPLSLLHKDKGKPDVGDVKANSNTIKRTLKKFNIDVEMDAVTIGSSVTRYAIKPAEGVKLEKIVGLQTNLEYALASSPIRIEAPIPGKSLVGIEVPNKQKQTLGLASLFSSPEYTDSPKPLLTALGKNITGEAQFADIARMPHGLIAGTTGSGKSVAIHNVVISLLFRNSPDQLRFIMVDPKRIELTLYNGIPHLLTPVIIDAKKVIVALKWSMKEMERRLDILGKERVQNIATYHETIYHPAKRAFEEKGSPDEERDALPEPLPYIVIIIDELADLMSTYPKELEACIVRLAQMSRAVGIHLILSTQRPSVNVITGLIKANVPTRIALQVASQIDSRTILDQSGAEKLLGQGDMLFLSAESPKPMRLQSAFVTIDEVKRVVSYLKDQESIQELDTINLDPSGDKTDSDSIFASSIGDDEDDDELYEDARLAVLEAGKASTSYLQRKLRLGYSRAARLMDVLEERGVIGPADGSRPRLVIDSARDSESEDEV